MQRVPFPVSESDETGDPTLDLLMAMVRLAQEDVVEPTTLMRGDDPDLIRQDAEEFLDWLPELHAFLRHYLDEWEVIREATR